MDLSENSQVAHHAHAFAQKLKRLDHYCGLVGDPGHLETAERDLATVQNMILNLRPCGFLPGSLVELQRDIERHLALLRVKVRAPTPKAGRIRSRVDAWVRAVALSRDMDAAGSKDAASPQDDCSALETKRQVRRRSDREDDSSPVSLCELMRQLREDTPEEEDSVDDGCHYSWHGRGSPASSHSWASGGGYELASSKRPSQADSHSSETFPSSGCRHTDAAAPRRGPSNATSLQEKRKAGIWVFEYAEGASEPNQSHGRFGNNSNDRTMAT